MSSNNDAYNSDELEAPDWLNKQFLQEVLMQYSKDPSLKLTDVQISPASAKGDHYASVMFRTSVEYLTQKGKFSKSLIIKTMPEMEGNKKEFLGDSPIFQTEIAMYTEVLPKFEAILREAGEETTFCTRCVYHSLEPRQVMIFEDLVPQGYEVIRNRNLTLDELRCALRKLAKWHAVSQKLLQEQPNIFDRLKYDITTLPNFFEQDFVTKALPTFIDMIGQVESLKDYRKYFEPMRQNIIKRWADIIREYRENRQENSYYVLCHGDFHVRNLMYKLDDCMLIDFQMSYVGSMVNDLLYAKYMLFAAEERLNNSDELISHYFDTFLATLSKIGYKGEKHSLVELRRQMFDRRFSDYMLLTLLLPLSYSMRQNKDPGDILQSEELRVNIYYNKDYQKELEYLLPRMLQLGYFELPE
ncbi:uncharacterized protein LOC135435254 [Drosophila montana]|uniref:uncharacterized protein LOC135435254 n=1 Tax=Drosophila montana TaxID=40370 RepID=UPI00313CAA2C